MAHKAGLRDLQLRDLAVGYSHVFVVCCLGVPGVHAANAALMLRKEAFSEAFMQPSSLAVGPCLYLD